MKFVYFFFITATTVMAAEAIDAEIVKNLDFYSNIDVVQNLDLASSLGTANDKNGETKSPAPEVSAEVSHVAH